MLCSWRGVLSRCVFHRSFKFFTFEVLSVVSPLIQPVRLESPPSVSQSVAAHVRHVQRIKANAKTTFRIRIPPGYFGSDPPITPTRPPENASAASCYSLMKRFQVESRYRKFKKLRRRLPGRPGSIWPLD